MKPFWQKNALLIIFFLGIYLCSAGISLAVFNYLNKPVGNVITPLSEDQKKSGFIVNNEGPKTEACPLNGKLFTKEEAAAWSKRSPLFVMIENHEDARPQSGLSSADVVYEAVAEGGISRFGIVFYCGVQAKDTILGPIRSARTYFLDWASEYGANPIYVHVGGANSPGPANALGQIEDYGWGGAKGNDINQFSAGFPTFWRDYERLGRTVATEHTMYSTTEKLWNLAKERGWTNLNEDGEKWDADFRPWKFADAADTAGETTDISFNFWDGYDAYLVDWKFDPAAKLYKRSNGGVEHIDNNNQEILSTANIVVQFEKESRANDGYEGNLHMLYGTIGTGKALIFQNGEVTSGTWNKKSRLDRTAYYDDSGKEISFVRGPIFIETVAIGTDINY